MSSMVLRNSEAFASEFPKTFEEMFLQYHIHSDVGDMPTSLNK